MASRTSVLRSMEIARVFRAIGSSAEGTMSVKTDLFIASSEEYPNIVSAVLFQRRMVPSGDNASIASGASSRSLDGRSFIETYRQLQRVRFYSMIFVNGS